MTSEELEKLVYTSRELNAISHPVQVIFTTILI